MFPRISGIENVAFFKGRYGDLAINIDAVPFNLDMCLQILIRHTNPLSNL